MEKRAAHIRTRWLLESVRETILRADDQDLGGDVQRERQHSVRRVRFVEESAEQFDGELAQRGRFKVHK